MENFTLMLGSLMDQAGTALQSAQTEITIFLVAFCIHSLFFRRLSVKSKPAVRMGPKGLLTGAALSAAKAPTRCSHAKALAHMAEHFCDMKDAVDVATGLSAKMQKVPAADTLDALAGLLEGAGKATTPLLLAAVRGVVSERSLKLNVDLGELLLRNYFGLRLLGEFDELYHELSAIHGDVPSFGVLALRAALRACDLETCFEHLGRVRPLWDTAPGTPSAAPNGVLAMLVRLAAQKAAVPQLLKRLQELQLLPVTIDSVLIECVQQGDPADVQVVLQCSQIHHLQFGEAAYVALIKNARSSQESLSLFTEAISTPKLPPRDIFSVAAEWALDNDDQALAEAVLKKLPSPPPAEAVCKILRFYGRSDSTIALRMYTEKFKSVDLSTDMKAMHLIAEASILDVKSGKKVFEGMLSTMTEPARVSLLKSTAQAKDLQSALLVLWASPDKGSCLYNAAIAACIDCRSIEDTQQVMAAAVKAGVADTATYNTMIKGYIKGNNAIGAQQAFKDMKAAGLKPNCVTFNELLDVTVKNSIDDAFHVLNEMRLVGFPPNRIACSIMLKAVKQYTKHADVERIIALLDEIEEDLDEVLLSSVVDACIRAGRTELLIPQLNRHRVAGKFPVKNSHTYASIIRAYSFAQDISGVWQVWREMRACNLPANAVTLGCMTEALVHNDATEAAHELIKEILKDEQWAPLVNAVMYCSVLKGFSHKRQFDRMWTVYEEMLDLKLQFSIVTFNTLLDGCSRNGDMARIPALLQDMVEQNIPSNIITYGIVLKGYCQGNHIEEAFKVVEDMMQTTTIRPDEVMFNTLLDGCARSGLYDRGIGVLEEMERASITPTNFTLSVLVKLASRSRMVDRCFELCQEVSAKYKIRLNVHVYANLINACITVRDLDRALEVFEKMLTEWVSPDKRTYMLLLRAFISTGQPKEAAGFLRASVGLSNIPSRLTKFGSRQLKFELPSSDITEILEGIAFTCQSGHLAMDLLKELRDTKLKVKLDPKLQFRLATSAINR